MNLIMPYIEKSTKSTIGDFFVMHLKIESKKNMFFFTDISVI